MSAGMARGNTSLGKVAPVLSVNVERISHVVEGLHTSGRGIGSAQSQMLSYRVESRQCSDVFCIGRRYDLIRRRDTSTMIQARLSQPTLTTRLDSITRDAFFPTKINVSVTFQRVFKFTSHFIDAFFGSKRISILNPARHRHLPSSSFLLFSIF